MNLLDSSVARSSRTMTPSIDILVAISIRSKTHCSAMCRRDIYSPRWQPTRAQCICSYASDELFTTTNRALDKIQKDSHSGAPGRAMNCRHYVMSDRCNIVVVVTSY
eukprot:scaffold951_cov18-Prasinocladus_malaysianus.AAC.1